MTNRVFTYLLGCSLTLSLFGTQLSAQDYQATPDNVSFDQVLALSTTEPEATVAYGSHPLQYGLLWKPESDSPAPLIVLIHGGCWLNSFDVNHSRALASALRQDGFAVWSLEYRRTGDPGGGWPGTLEDIQLALSQLDRLQDYGVDLSRVAVAGHSAGGHLALMAGASLPAAKAIVGLAAIVDMETYSQGSNSCQVAGPQFMGVPFTGNEDLYAQANPVEQQLHPQSLLLHGGEDVIVPLDHFPEGLLPTSVVAGAGHFDWIHPGTASYQLLLGTLRARFAQ